MRWYRQEHGFDSLPLLVRPGTVLPVGARTDRPDYDHADNVTLHLFELPDGYDDTTTVGAAAFRVVRVGDRVTVTATGTSAAWAVRHGKVVVRADAGTDRLVIDL